MDIITHSQLAQYYTHKSRVVIDKFNRHIKEHGINSAKKWLKKRLPKERDRTVKLTLELIQKEYPEIYNGLD